MLRSLPPHAACVQFSRRTRSKFQASAAICSTVRGSSPQKNDMSMARAGQWLTTKCFCGLKNDAGASACFDSGVLLPQPYTAAKGSYVQLAWPSCVSCLSVLERQDNQQGPGRSAVVDRAQCTRMIDDSRMRSFRICLGMQVF